MNEVVQLYDVRAPDFEPDVDGPSLQANPRSLTGVVAVGDVVMDDAIDGPAPTQATTFVD